jgi:hypothetical protein
MLAVGSISARLSMMAVGWIMDENEAPGLAESCPSLNLQLRTCHTLGTDQDVSLISPVTFSLRGLSFPTCLILEHYG